MYFMNEDERKKLLKGLLPKSREIGVAEELRGWSWHQPPLEPIYDVRLPLYQIAGKYCQSGRDVFLNRVEKKKAVPNKAMQLGSLFHKLVVSILICTKKLIYHYGPSEPGKIIAELAGIRQEYLTRAEALKDSIPEILSYTEQLYNYKHYLISSRLHDILSRQPYIGEDSLAAQVVPFVLEQKLDGTFLGLSPNLSADAFVYSEPMLLDLKFGAPQNFHRLTTTGYALVMEAIYEYPINIGCIVYCEFKNNRMHIHKDFHIINDELRQWFIEERDEKMRMVYDEIDPGISPSCAEDCPYFAHCS